MKLSTMTAIDTLGLAFGLILFASFGGLFGAAGAFTAVAFAASLAINWRPRWVLAYPLLVCCAALAAWLFLIGLLRLVMA